MSNNSSDLFQFASDIDGDLHLFPKNLGDPDYEHRWTVTVIDHDDTCSNAPIASPFMCVDEGVVSNPHGTSGHRQVAGWFVESLNPHQIEVRIDSGPPIIVPHPRRHTSG